MAEGINGIMGSIPHKTSDEDVARQNAIMAQSNSKKVSPEQYRKYLLIAGGITNKRESGKTARELEKAWNGTALTYEKVFEIFLKNCTDRKANQNIYDTLIYDIMNKEGGKRTLMAGNVPQRGYG